VTVGGVAEWQITLLVYGGDTSTIVLVHPKTADDNNYAIRYIYVICARLNGSIDNLASVTIDESEGGSISYIRNFSNLDASPFDNGEVWLNQLNISGVLGDPGSPHTSDPVVANVIGTVDVGGDITADIVAGPRLYATTSTIGRVQSTGGALRGHILAPYGLILDVLATDLTAGDIGAPGHPVAIWARNAISHVEANNIYASIDTTQFGDPDDVYHVKARNGDFYGGLVCRYLTSGTSDGGLQVSGTLGASVNVTALGHPSTINVGGELANVISFADHGLYGQVIVQGTPTSEVQVGSYHLSTPDYEVSSDSLGVGSYGIAPFRVNHADCLPVSLCDEIPCWDSSEPMPIVSQYDFEHTGVRVRFYGPVQFGASVPVGVYKAPPYSSSGDPYGWPDLGYNYAESGHGVDVTLESIFDTYRTLLIKKHSGATTPEGRYSVQPLTGGLLCNSVSGNPPVADFVYRFILSDVTPRTTDQYCGDADFDCDGDAGTDADISAFFACVAGSCPPAPCPNSLSSHGADFDGDGDIATDADIEAFFRVLAGGHC
jgi:hypothetical protein